MDRLKNIRLYSFIENFFDDEHLSETIKHSIWATVLLGFGAGLQFLFDFIIARKYGAEVSGVFSLMFTVLYLTSLTARLGFDNAILRFVTPYYKNKQYAKALGYKKVSFKIVISISFIFSAGVFLGAEIIANYLFNKPELSTPLRMTGLTILPFSIVFLTSALLRAYKLIKQSIVVKSIIFYLLSCIAVLALPLNTNATNTILIIFGVSIVISAITGLIIAKRSFPKRIAPEVPTYGSVLAVAIPLLSVALSAQIMNWSDTLLLGIFSTTKSVGIYNVALKMGFLISFVLLAVNTNIAPKFAELYHDKKIKELGSLARKTTLIMTLISLPLFLVLVLWPKFFLGLFGPEFTGGSLALVILSFGQLLNVSSGPVSNLLAMGNQERALALIVFASTVLAVSLNLILIPLYDVVGAAIGTAIGMSVKNILMVIVAKRRMGVSIIGLAK